jgi:hypothetical protein
LFLQIAESGSPTVLQAGQQGTSIHGDPSLPTESPPPVFVGIISSADEEDANRRDMTVGTAPDGQSRNLILVPQMRSRLKLAGLATGERSQPSSDQPPIRL